MARVFRQAEAKRLALPGRNALEILSGESGARGVTLRLVEIPVPKPGEQPRSWHQHDDFEECIFVLAGHGTTCTQNTEHPLLPGDTILVPPGEKHMTCNTGTEPLLLLCFFPVADIAKRTVEPSPVTKAARKP
jgi:quercetin dioxygenase-like cupin family protein